jgi:hypothetical protein
MYLRECPDEGTRIRSEAQRTAAYFTWEAAAENLISKLENQASLQRALVKRSPTVHFEITEADERKLLQTAGSHN